METNFYITFTGKIMTLNSNVAILAVGIGTLCRQQPLNRNNKL